MVEQLSGWLTIVADKDNEMSDSPSLEAVEYKRPKPKSSTLSLCEKFIFTYRTYAATGNSPSFSLCVSLFYITSLCTVIAKTHIDFTRLH